ncbi:DUF1624 domain-containing protein [Anaerobacillus sp. CMMVII]|uniref:heparan-alpha-glucosaminide N-acetyltransferase domain-containing protein n=1 Tax=Anaerobacillus sp. CMMVII TaxID=2755588 RepID=UPI0021B81974|nr:heparan-alpha-glucosaminide N-acetyltransferase domain-containing protein [Anaerobacillus sp. CMMVII]MCT8137651.1 DUF1624 domain-containing protein [Anaerobacillus sp. CMMVII]
MTETKTPQKKLGRIYSLDIARGFIILVAIFLGNIPGGNGEYEWARHARWEGLPLLDMLFPAFLTLFGIGMAVAYRNGIKWKKVLRRTIILFAIGLVYNGLVNWSIDLTTWRITGVLQLYAIVGLVVVILIWINRSWIFAVSVSLFVLFSYSALLSIISASCTGGALVPDCYSLVKIDLLIFSENHLWQQGRRGYDPEGIMTMFSAISNVLFGYAAGRILVIKRETGATKYLAFLAIGIASLVPILLTFSPIIKRIWTPAYAASTAAITIFLFALIYFLVDQLFRESHKRFIGVSVLEALGRNSLIIYFGRGLISRVLAAINVPFITEEVRVSDYLVALFTHFSSHPKIIYAIFISCCWILLAILLHRKKIYVRA